MKGFLSRRSGDRLAWFDRRYGAHQGRRALTLRAALGLLLERTGPDRAIVETGCMRLPNDAGDGGSTRIFGDFVKRLGGRVHTVDIEPRHVAACRRFTRRFARRISYHVGDSIEFLRTLGRDRTLNRIDLLYLDSYDYALGLRQDDERLACQRHCLGELEAALPLFSSQTLVLIDDADLVGGGKAAIAKSKLLQLGWTLVVEDYQVLFAAPKSTAV